MIYAANTDPLTQYSLKLQIVSFEILYFHYKLSQ